MTQPNTKSGARHSKKDTQLLTDSRRKLREIDMHLQDLGTPDDTPPDAGAESNAASAKASDIPTPAGEYFVIGAVKAAGDWELDICYMPYGGQHAGKDAHGEYFSPATKEYADKFPSPLILYYHGYTPEGKPQGEPKIIGEPTGKRWVDSAGRWMRIKLDTASAYTARMMDAAKRGMARVSSGSIAHLVRKNFDGLITNWPVVEISLIDSDGKRQPANQYAVALPAAKSHYQLAGLDWPEIDVDTLGDETQPEDLAKGESAAKSEAANPVTLPQSTKGTTKMDDKELADLVAKNVAAAMKAQTDLQLQEAKAKADEQSRVDAAVATALAAERANASKSRRLPITDGEAPYQSKFGDTRKYDGVSAGDLAVAMSVLGSAKKNNVAGATGYAPDAVKALAIKIAEDKDSTGSNEARAAMKAQGINPEDFLSASATKANELDHNTQAGYGDEWVGVVYSSNLWDAVRAPASIVGQLPSVVVPQGAESMTIPLEAADPTFYKVAATTANDGTMLFPAASVPSSKVATSNVSLTLGKGGARVGWNGELDEDSVIPFASQLRTQLEKSAAEQIEHLVIDGDTQTSSASINDSTGSLTTNLYLLFNGFRKSPLVTTTSNSRSAGGSLADIDFLATAQLMGTAGLLGADRQKTAFIIDANTQWKASQLLSVKTKDVYSNATLENGLLLSIWGYKVYTSYFMHLASAKRMAQTSGKIHTTDSNNTTGSILAVRFDQWMLGYKRRLTMEVTRYPRSDSSEITALFRIGLIQRDTEASAISYNVGV